MYRKLIPGKNINFLVLSRSDAKTMTPDVPYAVISIRDTDKCDVNLASSKQCKGVLRLAFQDADRQIDDWRTFTSRDARRILKFIQPLLESIECIVVNCEAGQSRSAGVAAGLCCVLNGNGEDSLFYRYYTPNSLVRRTILNEYENSINEESVGENEEIQE